MVKDIESLINDIYNKYADSIEKFDIQYNEGKIICLTEDDYGIKNKLVLTESVIKNIGEESIRTWVDNIIKSINSIKNLNMMLESSQGAFKIQYRYTANAITSRKSYVYDWDYNGVIIMPSLKSINILNDTDLDSIEQSDSYGSLSEFISNYFKNDTFVNALELNFDTFNIYDILSAHMLSKDAILNKVDDIKNKVKSARFSSVISSESLKILAKVNWDFDFENVTCRIDFDENKIFSMKSMEFIRDSEILNGILKLYKPSIQDIFS